MVYKIQIYFLLFIIYSLTGWILEVTCKSIENKRFMNRGFLLGPYCPIYGFGAILISLLLHKFRHNPFYLFIMAMIVCGILEYSTSFLMEKLFHLRWWDYSKRKWNIGGRVCAGTMIPFGLLGMFIMYLTNPFLLDKLYLLPLDILNIIFYTILIIFMIDNIISLLTILSIKATTIHISKEYKEDNTEEITKKVRNVLLSGKSFTQKRLLNAYPKLQAIRLRVKEKIKQTKTEIEKQKEKMDQKIDYAKENIYHMIKNKEKKKE